MKKMNLVSQASMLITLLVIVSGSTLSAQSGLWRNGISLIPYPQELALGGEDFIFSDKIDIQIDKGASAEDLFTAEELKAQLLDQWSINCRITTTPSGQCIVLAREGAPEEIEAQAYSIETAADRLLIRGNDAAGLFYGVQSLLQLIQKGRQGPFVKGMAITDWPEISWRAVHYDTKHFQEKKEYVKEFIRTLASYKVNMLIWEWEDKFAYQSHPEIGAPGAFTMEEMQELTRYARKYHVQIVPLVQGLGHVSFILKHPENKHLREIPSNNWGFCPQREGSYELMNDLLKEAIEATPGSEYIHIGCDETYVLGKGVECGCQEKAEEIGKYALRQIYINRVAGQMEEWGRQPISWAGGYKRNEKVRPPKSLLTHGDGDPENTKEALLQGYSFYTYDPNPGIEHMFLPYFYRESEYMQYGGHIERSYRSITEAVQTGDYEGMISTSWNCSGVHNQIWMLRYITAAEYSWSSKGPGLEEFTDKYFTSYYGSDSRDVKELFKLLNMGSYYYMDAFERKVWHWGEVGKTHLPDMPRDDIEYDPFWNTEYQEMVDRSKKQLPKMGRALEICRMNLEGGAKNSYDFEIFTGIAELFQHTAQTYLALSNLEKSITSAHRSHFDNPQAAYAALQGAVVIVEKNLKERGEVYSRIKATWEKSQFPKGMSTPEKKYVHGRDQQRNFANRRPDLSFMIYDEQLLGLEDYLEDLQAYVSWYQLTYL